MMIYGYIYKVTNSINGKVYIGQTTVGFDERYHGGIKATHNSHLKRAIEKYGVDSFNIEKEYDVAYSKEELDNLERYYIEKFKSNTGEFGYNKTSGGESYVMSQDVKDRISKAKRGQKLSMETRAKLSEIRSGEGNPMYGKQWSDEDKQRISKSVSKAITGEGNPMYGKQHTEETKNKISEKHSKKVLCKNTGEVFNSALEASLWCGLKHQTTICKSCKDSNKGAGKHPETGEKLYWQYVSDNE